MNNKSNLEELQEVLKNNLKKEEAVRDSEKDLATEVGAGAGKAFGWVVIAAVKITVETAKVFVAIWLLHYFGFLPLNG
jgi:hypothetical protein